MVRILNMPGKEWYAAHNDSGTLKGLVLEYSSIVMDHGNGPHPEDSPVC
jgi:hypothetical protein